MRLAENKKVNHQETKKLDEDRKTLMTPQSLMISQTYIVQNADASFDAYYQMMRKRKHEKQAQKNNSSSA